MPETSNPRHPGRLVGLARRVLARQAGQGSPILYRQFAELLDLNPPGAISRAGEILEILIAEDHHAGKPLLSSLVVGKTGIPRTGFFRQARKLGRYAGPDSGPEAEVFFRRELAAAVACYGSRESGKD